MAHDPAPTSPDTLRRRRLSGARRLGGMPEVWSPALSAVILCGIHIAAGVMPFGPRARNVGDLAAQVVPAHAQLWDYLHGQGGGSVDLGWHSGLGQPVVADYATYVSSPLSSLVMLLVTRGRVEHGVFWLVCASLALAALGMVLALGRIRPGGNQVLRGLLGASYACCAWSLTDGSYETMWLGGMVGFPFLLLAWFWALEASRPALGILVVALTWWSNYYTAFMASLGLVVFVMAWIAVEMRDPRAALPALLRLGWRSAVGVLLTSVILVPTFLAVGAAEQTSATQQAPAAWGVYLARLLPGTAGVLFSPSVGAGVLALVLTLSLPFTTHVDRRVRYGWTLVVLLVVASTQWTPTMTVWHLGKVPNGNPWREAFVVAGFLVIAAWVAAAQLAPRPRAVVAGTGLTLAILAWAALSPTRTFLSVWTAPLTVLGCVALVGWAVAGGRLSGCAARVAAAGAVVLMVVETVAGGVVMEAQRGDRLGRNYTWAHEATRAEHALAAWREGDSWPRYRFGQLGESLPNMPLDPSRGLYSLNDPALAGYPGLGYYSSSLPGATAELLRYVEAPHAYHGRMILPRQDPFLDPVLAINANAPDGTVVHRPAFPLVRPLPAGRRPAAATASVWDRRNSLLGEDVISAPPVRLSLNGGASIPLSRVQPLGRGQHVRLVTRCRPGSVVLLDRTPMRASVRTLDGRTIQDARARKGRPDVSLGVTPVGSAPASGVVSINAYTLAPGVLTSRPVGCLDEAALNRQIASAGEQVTEVRVEGATVSAHLKPGADTALFATTAMSGWSCSVDGRATRFASHGGFLAVPLGGGSDVTCGYRTPGLRRGALLSAVALIVGLAGVGLAHRRQRRRAVEAPTTR